MHQTDQLLRLNVGFLINQTVGYSRDFIFESAAIHLHPDLDLRDLSGTTKITRASQGLLVQVQMHACLQAECVRCLTSFALPLSIDFTELYAFSANSVSESGLILPDDHHINLGPLVREYMLLEIPINAICKPDCKGLCPICGNNLNEQACHHEPEATDPRLSVLKTLLDPD